MPSNPGHVIYAIGVTADFRQRPHDTMEAHVTLPSTLLRNGQFESFLYLSSTRIYRHAQNTHEDACISVRSSDAEDLYDISKLAGEALCQSGQRAGVRVARLSNVLGHDFESRNFVFDLMRQARAEGRVDLRSSLDSCKDYILVEDVLDLLPRIATGGLERCYNVASGVNLAHADILTPIVAATRAEIHVADGAPKLAPAPIDISRALSEFSFNPRPVLPALTGLVDQYRMQAC